MKYFMKIQENGFLLFVIVSWISYISLLLGITIINPKYLSVFDLCVKIYICLFLFWRFHPFRTKIKCNEFDRKIIFTSAVFIFTTSALNHILISYFDKTKSAILSSIHV